MYCHRRAAVAMLAVKLGSSAPVPGVGLSLLQAVKVAAAKVIVSSVVFFIIGCYTFCVFCLLYCSGCRQMSMSIVSAAVGSLPSFDRAFKATFDRKFQVTAYSQRTYAFAEIFGHSGDIGGDGARIAVVEGYVHLQRHIAVVCILYCKESEGRGQ